MKPTYKTEHSHIRNIWLLATIILAFAGQNLHAQHTSCIESDSFAIRTPQFTRLELICGDAPDTTDTDIALCIPAAFSAIIRPDFDHINVAGYHISNGKKHKGFLSRNNTGGIIFYNDSTIRIVDKKTYENEVTFNQNKISCSFGQCLVTYKGEEQHIFPRGPEFVAFYRVVCEKDGSFFIFETTKPMPRGRFMEELASLKVDNALYMEMGQDYNHSWWRNTDGTITIQHEFYRGTNWLVFKK